MKNLKSTVLLIYINNRQRLIDEIINNVKIVYKDDKKILMNVIDLTVELEMADRNDEFVDGMVGFITWASMTNQNASSTLTTLIHDLSEFARHRNESWFSPRTARYQKYLTGAAG